MPAISIPSFLMILILKVAEVIEDASRGDNKVTVTSSQLVNGKMKKTVKEYKTSEYYKE